jgi:hypothetical protein
MDIYTWFFHYPNFEKLTTEIDTRNQQVLVPRIPSNARFRKIITVPDHLRTTIITHSHAEFHWCLMPDWVLRRLLHACPHLESLTFIVPNTTWTRTEDIGYHSQASPEEFGLALLKSHSKTLKHLHLDFFHCYNLRDPWLHLETRLYRPLSIYTYPPSFRAFEVLTHLTIEFEKLVQLCHLPPSLEALTLTSCYYKEVDKEYLSGLLHLRDSWCPMIETVVLHGKQTRLRDHNKSGDVEWIRECARGIDASVYAIDEEEGWALGFTGVESYVRI